MASRFSSPFIVFVALAILLALSTRAIQAQGEVVCENLDHDKCAFAVSATGKRCVLENQVRPRSGEEDYTCRESDIEADAYLWDYVETERCVSACGVDRKSFGISSDSLLESRFTQNLCSRPCYDYCPNIVDLYFSLATEEGVFLPKLCETQKEEVRRGMSEIRSSGTVALAPGPV